MPIDRAVKTLRSPAAVDRARAEGTHLRLAREGGRSPGASGAEAEWLLQLQRAAGNRATLAVVQRLSAPGTPLAVQRKVKFGNKQFLKKNAPLPAIPANLAAAYQESVVARVRVLAEGMRDDAVTNGRAFANETVFYQALFTQVLTESTAVAGAKTANPWGKLAFEVKQEGGVRDVPWASFETAAAASLQAELAACSVQVSNNQGTTACHGNKNNRLPKKVNTPGGVALDTLPKGQQAQYTDYIEFLIPGHKSTIDIERAILDRAAGIIYITAHYESGSFVRLSGAPPALVANWTVKAATYIAGL